MTPDEEDAADEVEGCPHCGSTELTWVEGEYATGVVAPDGGREYWSFHGVKCLKCGELTET